MKTRMKPFALMAVLALGAAACEDGTTGANDFDDEGLIADAALVAADGMFQDLAHMQSPAVWGGMGSGPQTVGIEIEGSTSFSRTVTFFPDDEYDPETTTHMLIVSDLERDVTHTFWSAEIERHREMEVSNLFGDETERIWNGTATGEVSKSRHPEGGVVRTYEMESSAVIDEVVRGLPRAENPWPLSGTITRTIEAVRTKEGEEPIEKHIKVTITFDGDQFVTMLVDDLNGDGPAVEYEIDLAERNVKNRFQRMNN
ncbi:MAG: hypothetical protein PVJ76_03815 [Gemmatimonadota bacterium]